MTAAYDGESCVVIGQGPDAREQCTRLDFADDGRSQFQQLALQVGVAQGQFGVAFAGRL
jgi:hypothetical protein